MRRFLLDQGLAPLAAAMLRETGWDAVHVSEIGLDAADDWEILESARQADRVCVTLDHDFHAHLASRDQDAHLWCCCAFRGLARQRRRNSSGSYGKLARKRSTQVQPFPRIRTAFGYVGSR